MEWLPILQGISTPILLVIGGMAWRGMNALHDIDKRVAIIEVNMRNVKHEINKISS